MRRRLTRPLSELVRKSVQREPELGRLMLVRAIRYFNEGDLVMGKSTLGNYIDATTGFDELGKAIGKSPRSLKWMLKNGSNPRSSDLFALIEHLKKTERVAIEVSCKPARHARRVSTGKAAGEAVIA